MKIHGKKTRMFLALTCILYLILICSSASAENYWFVRCKDHGYGINFNLNAKKAFIILRADSGGTIPAASSTKILRYVNNSRDKFAIFDFGSATKIGVNVSREDNAIIYRLLQGKTYRVCDAGVSMK